MSDKKEKAKTILSWLLKFAQGENEEQQFMESALEDGTPITIAGEGIAEGAAVTLADGTPLADGEYKLADGTGITVAGGTITAVAAAEMPAEEEMEDEGAKGIDELKQKIADILSQFNSHKASTEKEIATLKADKAKQAQAFASQKEANKQVIAMLELLVKEPQAAPATPSKSPFASQKPDKEAAFQNLATTLTNLKKA